MSSSKLSREEWRKAKDLDAARKAGTAMPEVDEDGKYINPHTPAYLVKAPWYVDNGKPSLKHHKKPEDGKVKPTLNDWYERGQMAAPAATKFRKGACANCGAMTHKEKDCLERPRKKGAKWTGKAIAADEVLVAPKGQDFDSKRDRWNGYDPSAHKAVMLEHEAVEEERRKLREEEIDRQTSTDLGAAKKLAKKSSGKAKAEGDFGSSDEEDDDDDVRYAEKSNMAGQKVNSDTRITVRNLRIREDRAKYLYNLDPDSAYYDPKTRSMREAPDPTIRPEDAEFAGDNFVRGTGDVNKIQQLQLFAWQSEARGNDVHLQANPTMNELQHREYTQKKDKLRESTKGSILQRYGGAEHFDSVPKELLAGQSEEYVEYSKTGQPVRAQNRLTAPTTGDKEKQLYDGNHAMPWGTYFDVDSGKYGYDCCHSLIRNSYCTGKAGIEAAEASNNLLKGKAKAIEAAPPAAVASDAKDTSTSTRKRRARSVSSSSGSSTGSLSSSDSDSASSASSASSRHRRKRSRRSRDRRAGKHDEHDSRRHKSKRSEKREKVQGYKPSAGMGQGDVSARLDRDKLKAALREEEKRSRGDGGKRSGDSSNSKKPDWLVEAQAVGAKADKYGSLRSEDKEVTEEQLEAYRMKTKNAYEDPMANYRDEDDKA